MADLSHGGLNGSQDAEQDDVLAIVQREAQEAVRRIADQLHVPSEPREGPERNSKYRLACQAYEARRARRQFFDADLFGEPVWDLLMAMYREHLADRPMSAAAALEAADVPSSTAGRWLGVMERRGLITRVAAANADQVVLTDFALTQLEAYMEQLRTKSLMRVI